MNFSQLHERLRLELLRRIERGVLSPALLARQTGFVPAHVSNFLNKKRNFSLAALDKVLLTQRLSIDDLYPDKRPAASDIMGLQYDSVPLVAHSTAIHAVRIPADSTLEIVKVRSGLLDTLRERCTARRRNWERFVAVQITEKQAESMRPILPPRALLLIDRHYTSIFNYAPGRRTIFAVRDGNLLRFRYVEATRTRLLLRPYSRSHPIEVLDIGVNQTLADLLVGRVFLAISEY